ncbi:MAG: NUDIX hydrolase [Chitinophagaceae bacterium]
MLNDIMTAKLTQQTDKKPNINTTPVDVQSYFGFALSVDCVIFGFDENALKVLLIKSDLEAFKDKWSLLGDMVEKDEDLESASYRVLKERTGLDNVYLEQVQCFSKVDRHPAGRVITAAFYSLVNIKHHQLHQLDNELHWHRIDQIGELAFDHKNILNICLERLQKKVQVEPIAFNLLGYKFSLRELQMLYEAILGVTLDRRNFRKKLFATGLLTDLDEIENNVPHRPGKLYSFNKDSYDKRQKEVFMGINL